MLRRMKVRESVHLNGWLKNNHKIAYLAGRHKFQVNLFNSVTLTPTQGSDIPQTICSSNYITIYGLPRVHSIPVAESIQPYWEQIAYHDISVRWWK